MYNSGYSHQESGVSDEMINFALMSQQNGLFDNNLTQNQPMLPPTAGMGMNMDPRFVSDYDMMALLRAKEQLSMINRGSSIQDRMRTLQTHEQLARTQARAQTLEDIKVSSVLDGLGLKRHPSDVLGAASLKTAPGTEAISEEPVRKKRKKTKRPSDMPRRALSAYNIFFSEQREKILEEIEAKENPEKAEEEVAKVGDITKAKEKEDDSPKKAEAKTDDKTEESEDKEPSDVPDVMNRTFFPKRSKRAHRKVHGKIGLVQLARTVSKRWKDLSPEKKQQYKDLAGKDKERHRKVMTEYQNRKAAESMVSMGSPEDIRAEDTPTSATAPSSEQGQREIMAHQYQQRILAEMMAARQAPQTSMMGMPGLSGYQQMMLNNMNSQTNFTGGNLQNVLGLNSSLSARQNTRQWPNNRGVGPSM
jgi:hypothetical protein